MDDLKADDPPIPLAQMHVKRVSRQLTMKDDAAEQGEEEQKAFKRKKVDSCSKSPMVE